MSFKCFSLAMSIISIKSFVEENRIIKKQNAILKNGRTMLESPLKLNGEHYEMDFAQMEAAVDERTR